MTMWRLDLLEISPSRSDAPDGKTLVILLMFKNLRKLQAMLIMPIIIAFCIVIAELEMLHLLGLKMYHYLIQFQIL